MNKQQCLITCARYLSYVIKHCTSKSSSCFLSKLQKNSPAAGTGCMDLGAPLIPSHNSPWAGFVAVVLPWRGSAHYSGLAELPENSAIRNIPLGTLVWGGDTTHLPGTIQFRLGLQEIFFDTFYFLFIYFLNQTILDVY